MFYIDIFLLTTFLAVNAYRLFKGLSKAESRSRLDYTELVLYATFTFFIGSIMVHLIRYVPGVMFFYLAYAIGMQAKKIIYKAS